jgi:Domain of unknown function (DUF1992)
MTERKPSGASFTGWIEHKIREGQKAGKFDNLAGAGKPLPDIDRRRTADDWVIELAKRERLDVLAMLPASLALAKELEDLPDRLAMERSEKRVVEIVEDLNRRIREEHRRPQTGPPLRAMQVNVERVVEAWRDRSH